MNWMSAKQTPLPSLKSVWFGQTRPIMKLALSVGWVFCAALAMMQRGLNLKKTSTESPSTTLYPLQTSLRCIIHGIPSHHCRRISVCFDIGSTLPTHCSLCLFAVSDDTLCQKLFETKGADFEGVLHSSNCDNIGEIHCRVIFVDDIQDYGNFAEYLEHCNS